MPKTITAIFIAVLILNGYLYVRIFEDFRVSRSATLYFLDVGQGDSALINIPSSGGDLQVLVDGGPDGKVVEALARILPPEDRYLDLLVMTHPQKDHFGGLIPVLEKYAVGALLSPGRKGESASYAGLLAALKERGVPVIVLGENDRLNFGAATAEILSPSPAERASAEVNDASLVMRFQFGNFRALYTGDIGETTEQRLAAKYDLTADVLKVPHHGSRFSSSEDFLSAVAPKLAVVGVGRNSYGHPAPATLSRIKNTGALIFTTLERGTIRVESDDRTLGIETLR